MLAAASQAMKEIDLDSLNDARREMERIERSADEPVEEELLEPHGDVRTTSQNAEHLHQQFCCCVPSSLQCGIKAVVLVCVVFQNSSYALARRYSRGACCSCPTTFHPAAVSRATMPQSFTLAPYSLFISFVLQHALATLTIRCVRYTERGLFSKYGSHHDGAHQTICFNVPDCHLR